MLVYQYIPLCVKLIVSPVAAIALVPMPAAAVAMLTGYKLHLSGMQRHIRTMLRVALSIRARGLAQPVERRTPALVECLYPAMFGIAKKWVWIT